MIIQNATINLKRDEYPVNKVEYLGKTTLIHDDFEKNYYSKVDYKEFWADYYSSRGYIFESQKADIIEMMRRMVKNNPDVKGLSIKSTNSFISGGNISYSGFAKTLRQFDYKCTLSIIDLGWRMGHLDDLIQWANITIREFVEDCSGYYISEKAGININQSTAFLKGSNLTLDNLNKIIRLKIEV